MAEELDYIDFDDPAPLLPLDSDEDVKQGTKQWFFDRCGCISASKMSGMLAQGGGLTRKKYLYNLATERLTGKPLPQGYKSKDMEDGTKLEPEGRELYSFYHQEIEEVGFKRHPTIPNFGASPDGMSLCRKGGLELKKRNLVTHYDLIFNPKPPRTAMLQMYAQMSCWGFDYVDYGSYNVDRDDDGELILPSYLRLVVVRIERNQQEIDVIEREVKKFDAEINELVKKLRKY